MNEHVEDGGHQGRASPTSGRESSKGVWGLIEESELARSTHTHTHAHTRSPCRPVRLLRVPHIHIQNLPTVPRKRKMVQIEVLRGSLAEHHHSRQIVIVRNGVEVQERHKVEKNSVKEMAL